MLLLKNVHNIPGVTAAAWGENRLEILLTGRNLATFHRCPENEYYALLKTTDAKKFIEELKTKYPRFEEKTILG